MGAWGTSGQWAGGMGSVGSWTKSKTKLHRGGEIVGISDFCFSPNGQEENEFFTMKDV